MDRIFLVILASAGLVESAKLVKRLDNGLARTPPMGWNSYNHYACIPNASVIESNAKALVDFGLADLGYHYVTTDCGWTLDHRTSDGRLTWNETLFPNGFPALGDYIHGLGLGFGVYSDSGVQMCMNGLPNQTGSLYHETIDAETFTSWGADLLKYDNCYSSKGKGYPNVDYEPGKSPAPRYRTMHKALEATGRKVLYQICDWGVDFPSKWAPQLGNTWRITNDIVPEWRTIFRQVNQFPPTASYAGPGQWPDMDMLEIGNDIFTEAEEQTHFSLWSIMKSPLTIGCALKDNYRTVAPSSLAILKNSDALGFNQDSLGKAANLTRRYTDAGFDVWAGPLSGDRTVVALVNWNNSTVKAVFDLPDAGLQSATVKDIWDGKTLPNIVTSYSRQLAAHGTLLLELSDSTPSGTYLSSKCAHTTKDNTVFGSVYGVTDSDNYTLVIKLDSSVDDGAAMSVSSSATSGSQKVHPSSGIVTTRIALSASRSNTVTIKSTAKVESIQITPPQGTFYPSTSFAVSGSASHYKCTTGLCSPVGSKITNLTAQGAASISIAVDESSGSSRYIEMTYINNDVSLGSSWTNGTNSRNITVAVNGHDPVRLEVPLSGRSSELFSPMKGWGDPATLGVLVDGFGSGSGGRDHIVVSNMGGNAGVQPFGADFVGLRII